MTQRGKGARESKICSISNLRTISSLSYRRALQREHLRRLIAMVVRERSIPEDARTIIETKAHLSESVARIDEALKANIQRTSF